MTSSADTAVVLVMRSSAAQPAPATRCRPPRELSTRIGSPASFASSGGHGEPVAEILLAEETTLATMMPTVVSARSSRRAVTITASVE